MKTIKLAYYLEGDRKRYRVLVVKNSTMYSPGEILTQPEVDDLCRFTQWDVTIVSLDKEKMQ